MVTNRRWLWEIPLTVLVGVVGSLVAAAAVSRVAGFAMNPSVVAVLSGVLTSAAIAADLRRGESSAPRAKASSRPRT
jgi:hypothetical protein